MEEKSSSKFHETKIEAYHFLYYPSRIIKRREQLMPEKNRRNSVKRNSWKFDETKVEKETYRSIFFCSRYYPPLLFSPLTTKRGRASGETAEALGQLKRRKVSGLTLSVYDTLGRKTPTLDAVARVTLPLSLVCLIARNGPPHEANGAA